MMRHLFLSLVLFVFSLPASAVLVHDFPTSFMLKQASCSEGQYCMAMMNHNKTIGHLKPAPNNPNLFYFLNESQQIQLSIKMLKTQLHQETCDMQYCPVFYDFDIYEKNNHLIAKLELSYDVMQASYDKFKLYTKDRRYILIRGSHTKSTGTQSHLYDGLAPEHPLILISRSLFTLSLDSTITVLDKSRLLFTVDPNLISATLALYCNTNLFHANLQPPADHAVSRETLARLHDKLQNLAENQDFLETMHDHISDRDIKAAGKILGQRYQAVYGNFWSSDSLFDKDQKIQQLFDLGIDLILSHSLYPEEEKALFQFLITQLYINQAE